MSSMPAICKPISQSGIIGKAMHQLVCSKNSGKQDGVWLSLCKQSILCLYKHKMLRQNIQSVKKILESESNLYARQ